MFDFAWSEIALIGVVALVFIGPKDLPIAIKAISGAIKKARRMAGEFQTHVDEMVKDTDLQGLKDVRQSVSEIRNFDWRGTVERAVDSDGSLRGSFANPMPASSVVTPAPSYTTQVHTVAAAPAPAFVPPGSEPDTAILAPRPEPAPAFIPPEAAHRV